jgi:subtilisin family serine protease
VRRLGPAAIALVSLVLASGAAADVASDALIHADAARALGYTGQGVTVAILDTGIDDHMRLENVVAEHCIVPPDGCPDGTGEQDGPGSAQDDHGHGTQIADILAGSGAVGPVGTAPGVSLVVVKVANRNGRTSSGQIAAGLDWVRTHHPEVRVVNLSISGDIPLSIECSNLSASLQTYAASIDALRAQGTLVFAATGNNGATNGIPAPACFHGSVAVGAVYSRSFGEFLAPVICRDATTAPDQVACFSNTSPELDLLAAGAPIDAVGLGGADAPIAGTSAAVAQAAGAAAVVLQANPTLTADAVVALLQSTGVPIVDDRAKRTTPRVDLAGALGTLLGHAIPLPPILEMPPVVTPPLAASSVPKVGVSATRISFGSVKPSRTVRRTLVVRNTGTGFLTVRATASLATVSARPAKITVPAGARRAITVAFRPTHTGRYRGQVRLRTDDPARPTVLVAVRGACAA